MPFQYELKMMRNISKVVINKEEVIRYDHDFTNKIIIIYVGKGTDGGFGNFVQEPTQSLEIFTITGVEYATLVGAIEGTNKLIGAVTPNNLWAAIDATVARLALEATP